VLIVRRCFSINQARGEIRLRSSNQYRSRRFRVSGPLAAAILLIPLLLLKSSIASAQAVGTVQTYAGDVKLERAANPVAVVTGLSVLKGDRFTTGPNGRVVILLNDQSTLDLYESGVLVVTDQTTGPSGASTRVGLLSGILRSIVHVTAGGPPPNFAVHTPNAIAAARGTDYDTGYHKNTQRRGYPDCNEFTDVYTRSGKVQVTSDGSPGKPVELKENQSTTVACAGFPLPVNPGIGAFGLYALGGAAALEGAIVGGWVAAGGNSGGNEPKPPETPFR
jgi:FecR protein